MATLTLDLEPDLLHRAETRAASQGTSVDRVVSRYLETYAADVVRQHRALDRILEIADAAGAHRASRDWTRDQLHER